MTLKKLFVLGSVLGAAALLRDKDRRDRFTASAQDWWSNMRSRIDDLQKSAMGTSDASVSSASSGASSTFGAGATSRSSGYTTPGGGNGIY